jgi:tripartite-type tricarboxylate transporter receptor subunit TctC
VRAIATTGEGRSRSFPQLPAVAESMPGYIVTSYYGLLVPIATSKEIIARLNAEIKRTMALAEMRDRLAVEGADPVSNTPEQFGAFLRAEIERWAKVVKAANIRAD